MVEINELFRRMRNLPMYIKDNGKISSAFYSDSKGVSVNVDDNREIDIIISDEERLHEYYNIEQKTNDEYRLIAIISIKKNDCVKKEVCIQLDPVENNPYHAILKKSQEKIQLTSGQRKYLANVSKVVKSYDKELIKETKQ